VVWWQTCPHRQKGTAKKRLHKKSYILQTETITVTGSPDYNDEPSSEEQEPVTLLRFLGVDIVVVGLEIQTYNTSNFTNNAKRLKIIMVLDVEAA
jgi:hypothetical protein